MLSLREAIKAKNTAQVIAAIDSGADINQVDRFGLAPIHRAVSCGNLDILKAVLSVLEIDIQQQNGYGYNALHLAVLLDQAEAQPVVDCLLTTPTHSKFDVNQPNNDHLGRTALHMAICNGARAMIDRLLLVPDIDVNKADFQGCTPLDLAILKHDLYTVEKLLAMPSINLTQQYDSKTGPVTQFQKSLVDAIVKEHTDIAQALMRVGGHTIGQWVGPVMQSKATPVLVYKFFTNIEQKERQCLRQMAEILKDIKVCQMRDGEKAAEQCPIALLPEDILRHIFLFVIDDKMPWLNYTAGGVLLSQGEKKVAFDVAADMASTTLSQQITRSHERKKVTYFFSEPEEREEEEMASDMEMTMSDEEKRIKKQPRTL